MSDHPYSTDSTEYEDIVDESLGELYKLGITIAKIQELNGVKDLENGWREKTSIDWEEKVPLQGHGPYKRNCYRYCKNNLCLLSIFYRCTETIPQ